LRFAVGLAQGCYVAGESLSSGFQKQLEPVDRV
jgi:hypothetical protein